MSSSEEMALSLLHVLLLNNCTYLLEICVSWLSNTHNTIQLISCCSQLCVSESEQLGRPVRFESVSMVVLGKSFPPRHCHHF